MVSMKKSLKLVGEGQWEKSSPNIYQVLPLFPRSLYSKINRSRLRAGGDEFCL